MTTGTAKAAATIPQKSNSNSTPVIGDQLQPLWADVFGFARRPATVGTLRSVEDDGDNVGDREQDATRDQLGGLTFGCRHELCVLLRGGSLAQVAGIYALIPRSRYYPGRHTRLLRSMSLICYTDSAIVLCTVPPRAMEGD
jgi:hypothetical protein